MFHSPARVRGGVFIAVTIITALVHVVFNLRRNVFYLDGFYNCAQACKKSFNIQATVHAAKPHITEDFIHAMCESIPRCASILLLNSS